MLLNVPASWVNKRYILDTLLPNLPQSVKLGIEHLLDLCTLSHQEGLDGRQRRSLVSREKIRAISAALGISTGDVVRVINRAFTERRISFQVEVPEEPESLKTGVWIPLNIPFFRPPLSTRPQFVGSPYDQVGALIEFEGGKRWLRGDFCEDGTLGDKDRDGMWDELSLMDSTIVTRVKLLNLD